MSAAEGAPLDRYVVTEHLSEGGMGAIYVGKKLGAGGFEMEVVLKQLLPEFTQQEEFIDLFLREAKLSATLDHANIIHTIDLVAAGAEYFIVMEYLPGGDLRTLLKKAKRRGKRFSPAAAVYIAREVLSALAYAHVKRDLEGKPLRLIHRDVSPSNVLLSRAGEVKLTDFGIAKAATHTSQFYKVKGKIGYMSPEQAKSEKLDHRSDLYSLGVCLYEVLTGERLFVAAGLTTSADAIYSQPIPSVARKVPGIPPEIDHLMAKALARDPGDRYQTAGEFQEALARYAHRNGLLVSAPELAAELVATCGPIDQWRVDDDDASGFAERGGGTEVYDPADEDDEDDVDASDVLSSAIVTSAVHAAPSGAIAASGPHGRAKTEVDKFQGVELTSIINMIDLEAQGRALTERGAMPISITPEPMAPAPAIAAAPTLMASAAPSRSPSPSRPPPPPLAPSPPMRTLGPPPTAVPARPDTPPPLAPSEQLAVSRHKSTQPAAAYRGGRGRTWLVVLGLIALGVAIALVVALSGPNLAPHP